MKGIVRNRLDVLFEKNNKPEGYLKDYGLYVSDLLSKLDYTAVNNVMDCFLKARERGSVIFFAGNGGSAATASHFAQDLAEVGRKTGKKLFKTLSLADNVPFITALGNDYGYEAVFKGQMQNIFRKDDVLVAISASGNSLNIIEAIKIAKDLGGISVGLVGFDGGQMASLCNYVIHVVTDKGEYGPVEDIHLVLDHMITSYLIYKDLL